MRGCFGALCLAGEYSHPWEGRTIIIFRSIIYTAILAGVLFGATGLFFRGAYFHHELTSSFDRFAELHDLQFDEQQKHRLFNLQRRDAERARLIQPWSLD